MMAVYGVLMILYYLVFIPMVALPFALMVLCLAGEVMMAKRGLFQALLLPVLTAAVRAWIMCRQDAASGLAALLWTAAYANGLGALIGSAVGLAVGAVLDLVRRRRLGVGLL